MGIYNSSDASKKLKARQLLQNRRNKSISYKFPGNTANVTSWETIYGLSHGWQHSKKLNTWPIMTGEFNVTPSRGTASFYDCLLVWMLLKHIKEIIPWNLKLNPNIMQFNSQLSKTTITGVLKLKSRTTG